MRVPGLAFVSLWLFTACGDDGPATPDAETFDAEVPDAALADAAPVMAAEMVDETGGTVETPGGEVSIAIPPGAVDGDTMITIATSDAPAPAEALGPVYEFGPAGLVFAHPVTITLALPDGTTAADIYWSKPAGAAGFDNAGGVIAADEISTEVVHFSEGFVGAAETSRTVTGSQIVAWVSASTFQLVPSDLAAFSVAALVEDGAGGYTTIAGVGNPDGTFAIPDVPDGPYWLRVPGPLGGSAYYRTTASAVDAGFTKQGRPDAQPVTAGTLLQLDVTNLEAWEAADQIEAFSSENYSWYFQAETYGTTTGVPNVDDTALTGFTLDLSTDYAGTPHRIDGSHVPPDRFVVAQLSHRTTTSAVDYNAMARIFEPAAFSVTSSATTTVTGAFTDVTTGETLALDIRADAIRASLTEESRPCVVPASWPYGWTIYVLGVAGGLQHGITGATADFLAIDLPTTTPDVAGTDFMYGTPLGGTWGTYGDARFTQPCEYTPPGASTPTMLHGGGIYLGEPIATFGSAPLTVKLSQVRAPTIDGTSLFTANTGVALTPTIAWTAPAIGTPSFYQVVVERLYADTDTNGQHERVAELTTDQTSVTLPAGVLVAGQTYVIGIAARSTGRADPSAFNREVLPEYTATIWSQIQQP